MNKKITVVAKEDIYAIWHDGKCLQFTNGKTYDAEFICGNLFVHDDFGNFIKTSQEMTDEFFTIL